MSITLCRKCEKRESCVELCFEAEEYVNQDYTPQKDYIPNEPVSYLKYSAESITKSKEELILLMYFVDRNTQMEIAKKLYVSQPYVSQVVSKYKGILVENIKKSLIF